MVKFKLILSIINWIFVNFATDLKVTSFILSLIVLIQSFNFDLDDFNKVPNFIKDINCHIQAGENFTDFIADHYGEFEESHEHKGNFHEHEEHGELPFKHQHADTHFQLVFILVSTSFTSENKDFITKNNNFCYKESFSNLSINSFLQPPRI